MPRSKKSADLGKISQSEIKALRKKSREILKAAGRDVRSVRHEVAALKKAGLVSKRVDVRSYLPTKYMLRKIERNRDVLSGDMIAVPAPKSIREKYAGIFEPRGSTLIVPREYKKQKTRIHRGLVEYRRDLRMGEEIRLVLPFKATDMENVANKLLSDPTLEGMKKPNELFGFRMYGHNMGSYGFPNTEELADYILRHYAHMFKGKQGREGVKHFELFRFRSRNSQMKPGPEDQKIYSPGRRKKKQDNRFIIEKRKERDAARKSKLRDKETPAQREKRLAYQRRYQAQKRQRKWEDE